MNIRLHQARSSPVTANSIVQAMYELKNAGDECALFFSCDTNMNMERLSTVTAKMVRVGWNTLTMTTVH